MGSVTPKIVENNMAKNLESEMSKLALHRLCAGFSKKGALATPTSNISKTSVPYCDHMMAVGSRFWAVGFSEILLQFSGRGPMDPNRSSCNPITMPAICP